MSTEHEARERLVWIRENLPQIEANGRTWFGADRPEEILMEVRPKFRNHWERVYGLSFNEDDTVAARTCNYMNWSVPMERIRVSEDAR